MKIEIKADGKVVASKEQRNTLHFNVQRNARVQVVQSKKVYKRSRDGKVPKDY